MNNTAVSPTTVSTHVGREEFQSATRSLTSLLATMEKRTLIWLAKRMPRWVNSDHLTAL